LSTINYKEIEKFSKLAEEWWDPNGKFKPIHNFNPIRIQYIKEKVIEKFKLNFEKRPFANISLLDIGCGGGLLSEPMCRLGAKVTGIDASKKNIDIAKIHAKKNNLEINYINASPEKLDTNKKFDIILNMEIIEHVENLDLFLKISSDLLSKNGIMFVATINRSLKSYAFAIIGAEYILRWLPIGTHDWNKFVKPNELANISDKNKLKLVSIDGVKFNPLSNEWKISEDTSVNYISCFEKK